MSEKILAIHSLDQISEVEFPFSMVVAQIENNGNISYTVTVQHARFVRSYTLKGLLWGSGRQFAFWAEHFFQAFSYDNSRYPLEIFPRDLKFCEVWFDRHFMRKREIDPVAI